MMNANLEAAREHALAMTQTRPAGGDGNVPYLAWTDCRQLLDTAFGVGGWNYDVGMEWPPPGSAFPPLVKATIVAGDLRVSALARVISTRKRDGTLLQPLHDVEQLPDGTRWTVGADPYETAERAAFVRAAAMLGIRPASTGKPAAQSRNDAAGNAADAAADRYTANAGDGYGDGGHYCACGVAISSQYKTCLGCRAAPNRTPGVCASCETDCKREFAQCWKCKTEGAPVLPQYAAVRDDAPGNAPQQQSDAYVDPPANVVDRLAACQTLADFNLLAQAAAADGWRSEPWGEVMARRLVSAGQAAGWVWNPTAREFEADGADLPF